MVIIMLEIILFDCLIIFINFHLNKIKMINRFQLSNRIQPVDSPSFDQSEESVDILVSKHQLPPPLTLLPKDHYNRTPKSLLPIFPLPNFVGIIPKYQPLDPQMQVGKVKQVLSFNWIGQAFNHVVYRKYEEQSYMKIDNMQEHWNIWACDISKIVNGKSPQQTNNQIPLTQYYSPTNIQDETLIFQSRFQSGNLSMASKVSQNQYNLLMQNDINTNGYSQWFFFRVCNKKRNQKITFNIVNQYKQNNLYRMGMKIMIYSKRSSEDKNISWHRGGEEIRYYENGYSRSSQQYRPYFTLSWKYEFAYDEDEVYFAYSYPYTYTHLNNFIQKIENDPQTRHFCQRNPLCKTLAGNNVDVLTITEDNPYQKIDKLYVVITARIHPGQSVSSYACKGILQFLLSSDERAKKLRKYFIFKVIPMLNPDGVIHGNYRSNISGHDLNKKWQNPSKIYHPEIYYLKKLILGIQQTGQIVLFCDLHGHSMKKNFFVYGSHDSSNPKKGKEFPLLLSKLFQGFSFKDSSFLNKQFQQGTSRTFLVKQLKHCDIYSFQSSFCGPEHENIHYTIKHFEQLGEKFCEAMLLYYHDKIKDLYLQAAIKQQVHFTNKNEQFEDIHNLQSKYYFDDLNNTIFQDRVNSEYSQLSEDELQHDIILEDKIIKKFLLMRFMRSGTTMLKRSNVLIRKSQSKEINKIRYQSIFRTNNKAESQSPDKKTAAESPIKKNNDHKIILNVINERKQLKPKLFEAIDIMPMTKGRKRYQSMGKIIYENEKIVKQPEKPNIKITLNKNYEFGLKETMNQYEPIFKNNYLKNFTDNRNERAEFIIKKKFNYPDQKNSINLFSSVLSSLRKDKI